ncbi:hypothetical protein H8N00_27965 [Streptomyces sp. AC563]|uniref:hypothetical protein n=1 Tax=Streptomyces buecherae TaxID=2763006 RepID=UPI00164CE306|nr:hypothetical protein [Streptomyces buecherae]MBC3992641.1 hypothetical protein [Streptomyces buecherae]
MIGAVLGSLLLCGGAAGCGSSSSLADVQRRVEAHSEAKPSPSPSAFRATPTEAVRQAAQRLQDAASLRARATIRHPEEKARLLNDIVVTTYPFGMNLTLYQPDKHPGPLHEFRTADGKAYMKGDAEVSAKLRGRPWVEVARTTSPDPTGNLPTGVVELMPSGIDHGRVVGAETIEGEQTTHYRGTYDLAAIRTEIAREADPGRRGKRTTILKEYEAMGVKQFATDIWIDTSGFVKQFTLRAKTPKGPLEMTMVYVTYDDDIVIDPPPTDQIASESDVRRAENS